MSSLNDHSASESYSWSDFYNNPSDSAPSIPKSCSLSAANFAGPYAIPVIDLADPDALRHMTLAFESWGAFQLIGHGVPHHVLENINTEARRLFLLPLVEKMKIARAAGSMEGFGSAPFQALFSKQFWSEGFSTKSSAETHQMASKLWSDGSTFCKAVEEYRKEIDLVSTKLVQMMLLSLGLTEVNIKRADLLGLSQKEREHLFQLNWYPACPEPEIEMGMPHHVDSGIITMIYSNSTGLQLLRNEDQHSPAQWVTVPLIPDSFIVLVGDLGHILSNGRYPGSLHRAMVNQVEPRLSVVSLWTPTDNVKVSPVVSGFTGKPVYRPVTWPEYLSVKRKILYKATDAFKLNEVEEKKNDGSTSEVKEEKKVPKMDQEKKDESAADLYKMLDSIKLVQVKEEKKDGSTAPEVEEEKKVPKMDQEKKDESAADLYKTLDSIKLIEVKEEEKNGSTAPEVEEEKKNSSASKVVEENKMPKVEEEKSDSPVGTYN